LPKKPIKIEAPAPPPQPTVSVPVSPPKVRLTAAQERILIAMSDMEYAFPGRSQSLACDKLVDKQLAESTHRESDYNGRTRVRTFSLVYRRTSAGKAVADRLLVATLTTAQNADS